MRAVTIGTRGSSLSLCQTEIVRVRLEERFPQRRFEVKTINAKADQSPDVPLVAMGGEGIFVKELELALMRGEIDLAIHSMKDLPLAIPEGVVVAAVTEREDARDALVLRPIRLAPLAQGRPERTVEGRQAQDERHQRTQGALMSRTGSALKELPAGSRVGTSSPRRRSQLLALRDGLEILDIRGNVDTRLRKLDEGRYDAIVVAACGLIRLGLEERITQYLSLEEMLPEPGQGALGIEARSDNREILEIVTELDEPTTRACVEAERAFLAALGGGCRVPIAAYAQAHDDQLSLDGAVIAADGSRILRDQASGPADASESLGEALANRLIAQGAHELLKAGLS